MCDSVQNIEDTESTQAKLVTSVLSAKHGKIVILSYYIIAIIIIVTVTIAIVIDVITIIILCYFYCYDCCDNTKSVVCVCCTLHKAQWT